uniref:Polyprotein n=1 Tax=Planarian secretory cell nidovirus TaxID=2100419 RepID=A0A386TVL0_9NIDO|nr:polyprotein [Planarian secretory cell nidovirus]
MCDHTVYQRDAINEQNLIRKDGVQKQTYVIIYDDDDVQNGSRLNEDVVSVEDGKLIECAAHFDALNSINQPHLKTKETFIIVRDDLSDNEDGDLFKRAAHDEDTDSINKLDLDSTANQASKETKSHKSDKYIKEITNDDDDLDFTAILARALQMERDGVLDTVLNQDTEYISHDIDENQT